MGSSHCCAAVGVGLADEELCHCCAVPLKADLAMPSASGSTQVLKSGGVGGRSLSQGQGFRTHTTASRDAGTTASASPSASRRQGSFPLRKSSQSSLGSLFRSHVSNPVESEFSGRTKGKGKGKKGGHRKGKHWGKP